eukprot:m.184541 g.184541  ORF g.184541 m.184541 type:complete len:237 (+) comp39325_c0_seq6:585-1295(+)
MSLVEVTGAAVECPEDEPQAMLLPALSKSRPDFTEKRAYKYVVTKMQECEYNGQYDKLRRISRFFERKIKQPELLVAITFERAIGELYQKNLKQAEKFVRKGLLMCHTKVKSATNARALEGRAFYIHSGIKRHQKRLCSVYSGPRHCYVTYLQEKIPWVCFTIWPQFYWKKGMRVLKKSLGILAWQGISVRLMTQPSTVFQRGLSSGWPGFNCSHSSLTQVKALSWSTIHLCTKWQ